MLKNFNKGNLFICATLKLNSFLITKKINLTKNRKKEL